ncbi:MAG TPA: S4 domain-containing protein [Usitatibacter sp.]|jgi:ribosome-associated heat shock protein Hsp15|nr:S4 domain-containing protein [Usitatibacter sp.]
MRIDKWLWAARFFKTRSLAVQAIEAGHVSLNGERAKAAKALKRGDEVVVRRPPFEHHVIVKALAERRGPASEAALLYEETAESRARRTMLAAEMKALPAPRFKGRPTKKTRRDYEEWLRSGDDEETGSG